MIGDGDKNGAETRIIHLRSRCNHAPGLDSRDRLQIGPRTRQLEFHQVSNRS